MIGGGALWILGDLVGLPFLAAQLIQMIREDEEEAARSTRNSTPVDQRERQPERPSRECQPRGRGARTLAEPGSARTPEDRPWWENDPRFTGRFQRSAER